MRLIQLFHPEHGRRVAKVNQSELIFISPDFSSCFTLFEEIIRKESTPQEFVPEILTDQSLDNIEYHHFKYARHRIPGTVHIHFFGADAFSFGEGIVLEDGDLMSIRFEGFGKPLVNPIRIQKEKEKPVIVRSF